MERLVPGFLLCAHLVPVLAPSRFRRSGSRVSGFCIHLAFHQQGKTWGQFFIRRFFRIYPPYLAALAFCVVVIYVNSGIDFHSVEVQRQIWAHLCLIHNVHPVTFEGINGSFWSLAVEAQLYLLYSALLACIAKIGWRKTLVILAVCEGAIRAANGLTDTTWAESSNWGRVVWVLGASPLGFWFSWAVGAFVADAFLKSEPLPRWMRLPGLWLCLGVGSYFFKPLSTFLFPMFALATAATTARLLARPEAQTVEPGFVLRCLKNIGLWSYSLYLIHDPLLRNYWLAITWATPEQSRPGPVLFFLMLLTLLLVIAFAILFYKVFELPAIALGKRIVSGSSGKRIIPPVALAAIFVLFALGSLFISARFSMRVAAANNNHAWALATSPEPARRDGGLAVRFAEDACRQTRFENPLMVGTLAAAYAEAGRFEEAISAAEKACALASQSGDQGLVERNQQLLGLYRKHQAYHEALPPSH
ncbi:MAG: hypothetical protein C5B50_18005 [Verrucomicrobia bacterium]|nr:MAG: hypothetical protein C5B50_18005 [Verrucomicrobiota bacterium]